MYFADRCHKTTIGIVINQLQMPHNGNVTAVVVGMMWHLSTVYNIYA